MRLPTSLSTGTDSFAAIQQLTPSSRRRLSGLRCWAVVLLATITALSAAVLTTQAQGLPEVSIATSQSTAIVGLDYVQFDLTRTGATTEALSVTVSLSQTGGTFLMNTGVETVTFDAGNSTANLFFGTSAFSSTASGIGTLTAAVGTLSEDYSVGAAGSASVSMYAVSGVAMTVKLSAASYSFDEDEASADRQLTIVAEMAQGITVSLGSGETETNAATSGTDFTPLSEQVSIAPSSFSAQGGRQVDSGSV